MSVAIDATEIALILERYSQPGQLIRATLEGAAPGFLMHSADAMQKSVAAAEEAKRKGQRSKFVPTPEAEAKMGAYQQEDGTLYLPVKNILRSCVEAGKAFKVPKQRVTQKYAVAAGVTTPIAAGVGFPLLNPDTGEVLREYEIDTQRVVVQRAAIMRSRPLIKSWAAEVEFLLELETLDIPTFAGILGYAGSRVGLGDGRPEKGGPYGRFKVASFEVGED